MPVYTIRYLFTAYGSVSALKTLKQVLYIELKQCILNAKSNFTLFSTEYIYTRYDFNQMEFCH